jgi:hypothetical protein
MIILSLIFRLGSPGIDFRRKGHEGYMHVSHVGSRLREARETGLLPKTLDTVDHAPEV